jgi:hypothetical protein
VITSWNYQTTTNGVILELTLKIARPAGGGQYRFIGESTRAFAPSTPTQNQLFTTLSRIPVKAGDMLGFHNVGATISCDREATPFSVEQIFEGDPAVGTSATPTGSFNGYELNVSAQLEADADNDGYGDETQDQCPSDPATQGACPAPPDADGDGVPDAVDNCPAEAGSVVSSGCPAGDTAKCDAAKKKLKKAKAKLKKLKRNDASKDAISKAKKRVKKAKGAVNEAC